MHLVRSVGPVFDGAVFVLKDGRRHYVRDNGIVRTYGLSWSELRELTDDELSATEVGQWAPNMWPDHIIADPPMDMNSHDMREILASSLSGTGVEIGAFDSPFPTPLHCKTTYVDYAPYEQLKSEAPPEIDKKGLVRPAIVGHFEDLSAIPDGSQDYFIASHVIEHTRNPINCIISALRKLKLGGSLVLVVPDKHRTFDNPRKITDLEHLIQDYSDPSADRDWIHYDDYFYNVANKRGEDLSSAVKRSVGRNENIHFHVWDFDSFRQMADYIATMVSDVKIRNIDRYTTRLHKTSFEFYFKFTV